METSHAPPPAYDLAIKPAPGSGSEAMTDDVLADSLLGQQLDEYRLDAMLGQGAMGRVYRGFDVRLERLAAVKVIHTSFRCM